MVRLLSIEAKICLHCKDDHICQEHYLIKKLKKKKKAVTHVASYWDE